jgi:protease-4
MGADSVTAAFRAAIEDKAVKAILFRVDSPGGSYVASDAIWREVVRAKRAGKPVMFSMGNMAGSGGYFVAMAADKIVAQPATITGSIGVLGGKPLTTDFWHKAGVSWDEVHTSNNATMWTWTQDYTAAQWARLQGWLGRI